MYVHRTPRSRRSAVLAQVVITLSALMALLALALDGGILLTERRHAQAVADAAALAGAAVLFANSTNGTSNSANNSAATAAANTYIVNNGYDKTLATVNCPPQTGDHVNQQGYIEVIVNYNQTRFFSSIWGSGNIPISARAVARGILITGTANAPSSATLLVTGLGGAATPFVTMDGGGSNKKTGDINLGTGTFAVNAPNPQPPSYSLFDANGNPTVNAGAFVFGASSSNLGSPPNYLPAGSTPTLSTTTADPLSSLAANSTPNSATLGLSTQNSNTGNLSPGIYTGVISNATLSPGIYYVKPNGSGSAGLTGPVDGTSGVFIYIASTGGTNMTISGGGISLNPINTGTYKGISLWVDSGWSNANASIDLGGNSTGYLFGTVYAPTANITEKGTPSLNIGSQVIISTITVKGDSFGGIGSGPVAGQSLAFQLVE